MTAIKNWMLTAAISCFVCPAATALTTTTETIEKTTTVAPERTVTTITLAPGGTYNVIDPRTGALIGRLDASTYLVGGQPLAPGVVITDVTTGEVVAAVNQSGSLIDVAVTPASDVMIAAIEQRRAAFDKVINDSVADGQLSLPEAAGIRVELDRIAANEMAASKSGAFTYAEALALADQLDAVQLEFPILTTVLPAPIMKTHFIVTGQIVKITDEIAFRRASLENRINAEYNAGHISTYQVAALKDQLNDISSREAKYKKDGVLSDSELHTLDTKLNRVQERLDSDVAYIEGKRARMGIVTQ